MKKLMVLFVFLFCKNINAQKSDYKSYITFGIVSSLANNRWSFGYMHPINDRIWLGIDLEYGAKGIILFPKLNSTKYQSFAIKPEFYYSLAPQSRLKHFISAELFYVKTNSQFSNFYYKEENVYYIASLIDYEKDKTGLNINYSILLGGENSRIAFIPKIGFGVKNVNRIYRNEVNKNEVEEFSDEIPYSGTGIPGQRINTNFNFDIKFVFKF